MANDNMQSRRTQAAIGTAVYIPIFIAVLGAINYLGYRNNKTYDTTANKRFSVSDKTETAIKAIKTSTTLTYFDDPTKFQQAKDLLTRYDGLSSKLKIDYVDVLKDNLLMEQKDVEPGTLLVESGKKSTRAKQITEEEVTSAIIRVTNAKESMVCFLEGYGESVVAAPTPEGYQAAKMLLEQNTYQTKTVSLASGDLPPDCTVVISAGPQLEYPENVVTSLKGFVEGGGRALFMLDPPLKTPTGQASENAKLRELLKSWGITFNNDLVIDASGAGRVVGAGPTAPVAVNYEGHPIVRKMNRMITLFPVTQSLTAASQGNASAQGLFSTSSQSVATKNLAGGNFAIGPDDKRGPFTIGVASTYRMPGNEKEKNKEGRVVATGTSRWMRNSYVNGPVANRSIFISMVNWLTSDEQLIGILPTPNDDRRLTLTEQQARGVVWTARIFIPLLAEIAGIAVWMKRR